MTALFWLLALVVLLALFGWALAGFVWTVLWYVLVGIVIGSLARVLVRGTGRYGMGMTIIAGIGGSLPADCSPTCSTPAGSSNSCSRCSPRPC